MKNTWKILILIILLSGNYNINAQIDNDTVKIWRIILVDGNEFYGTIQSESETSILMVTNSLGELKIPRNQIRKMQLLNKATIIDGQVWLENLQATRYFWAPNGYGLKKGEGYYQNVWVLFNQASVGLTNNFSIGGGTVPLFLFDGAPTPVFVVPKFSIPIIKDKLNFGAGMIAGTILSNDEWFENIGPFGIAYGVISAGNKDRNANLGIGAVFSDGELADAPIISIGGMARINRRNYFVTENYLYPGDQWLGIIALGGRTVWQRVSLDYGAVIPIGKDFDAFVVIPWLGLSIPFQY